MQIGRNDVAVFALIAAGGLAFGAFQLRRAEHQPNSDNSDTPNIGNNEMAERMTDLGEG